MKKRQYIIFLFAVILPWGGGALHAQDADDFPRHYLEVRFGDPVVANLASGMFGIRCVDDFDPYTLEKGDIWTGNYTQSYCKSSFMLPTFTVAYHYAIRHWLHIGPVVSYHTFADRHYDMRTDAHLYNNGRHFFSMMADVRFQYLDRRIVGLYSGAALGVGLGTEFYDKDNDVIGAPVWQITALGLRVGNRVYWNTELGFGVEGFLQTGIGCRF